MALTDWFQNQGIPSTSMGVPRNMQPYFSGTDWRSNMNPQNTRGMNRNNLNVSAINAGTPNMRDVSGEYINTGPDLSGVNLDDTSPAQIRFKSMDFPNQQKWTGTKNNPAFGFLDRNFNYKDLNKPDIQAMEPSLGGIGQDRRGFNWPNFGLSGIMKGIKDQFEYRPSTETAWDPNTGEMVTAEEQDQMNALGGYYSDPARNQRRQRARVTKMLARQQAGKKIGENNLRRLIELGYGPKETITTTAGGDQINQGGGGYDRGYTQSQRAGVEAYHGRGGGKEMMSQGGYMRSGYNRGGRVGILSIF